MRRDAMILAVLLAMALSWDAVTLDCRGGPEPAVVYEIAEIVTSTPANWATDMPDPTLIFGPTVIGITPQTSYSTDLEPAPGECVMVRVTAIDAAGNRSDQECLS